MSSHFSRTSIKENFQTMKAIDDHDEAGSSESSVDDHSIQSNTPSFKSSNHNAATEKSDKFETIRNILSRHGTPAVFYLRLLVILIMTLTATAVSVIIYRTTSDDEDHKYNSHYDKAAETVLKSFESIFENVLTITSVGVAATAFGLDHNETRWPFHTMSSFQQRAATARQESGALFISINPIVTDDDRYGWEEYVARNNEKWM
jgi:hypothetical protein